MVDTMLDGLTGEPAAGDGEPTPAAAPAGDDKLTQAEFTKMFDEGGWFETLPEELANEPSLAKYIKGPHSGIAKAYVNLSKSYGDRVPRPRESFTKNEWSEWNKEHNPGYPGDAEGYGLAKPDDAPEGYPYDPATEQRFGEIAHNLGITVSQAKGMWAESHKDNIAAYVAQKESFDNMKKEDMAVLKKEWGAAAPQKLAQARAAIQKYADKDLIATMSEEQIGSGVWKMLAKMGESIQEGTIEDTTHSTSTRYTPKEANAKAMEYQMKAAKASQEGDRISAKKFTDKASEYFKEAVATE